MYMRALRVSGGANATSLAPEAKAGLLDGGGGGSLATRLFGVIPQKGLPFPSLRPRSDGPVQASAWECPDQSEITESDGDSASGASTYPAIIYKTPTECERVRISDDYLDNPRRVRAGHAAGGLDVPRR